MIFLIIIKNLYNKKNEFCEDNINNNSYFMII